MCKRGIKALKEAVQEQTIGKVVWISGEGLMCLRKSFVAVMGVKINVSRNITRRKKEKRRRREREREREREKE